MISLLLHESEAKPRTSVKTRILYECTWDITGLFPKRLYQSMPASFVKQQAMASGYIHLSKLSLYNKQY